ncbi:hypothetical protein FQR65_LT20036 [Abscondita terminalis]|nr:hypothetical protein FQR65_LT20036 [Abscondita terminalis]
MSERFDMKIYFPGDKGKAVLPAAGWWKPASVSTMACEAEPADREEHSSWGVCDQCGCDSQHACAVTPAIRRNAREMLRSP